MATAKERVRQLLDTVDDGASLEEIQYRIYVLQKIEAGLRDAEEGHLISHEEVKRRMGKWLDQ